MGAKELCCDHQFMTSHQLLAILFRLPPFCVPLPFADVRYLDLSKNRINADHLVGDPDLQEKVEKQASVSAHATLHADKRVRWRLGEERPGIVKGRVARKVLREGNNAAIHSLQKPVCLLLRGVVCCTGHCRSA